MSIKQFGIAALVLWAWTLMSSAELKAAPVAPYKEKTVVNRQEGFLVCAGGGASSPLFSKDCKEATFVRLPGLGYEGTCLDHNGRTFLMACQALNFEYLRSPEDQKKSTYWQKSKQNKTP